MRGSGAGSMSSQEGAPASQWASSKNLHLDFQFKMSKYENIIYSSFYLIFKNASKTNSLNSLSCYQCRIK